MKSGEVRSVEVKFLLDTDVMSSLARDASAALAERIKAVDLRHLAMSVVTRGEIEFGLAAQPPKRATLERMLGLLAALTTLPLQTQAAQHYRSLRHALTLAGTPIGGNDMWIAAHALADQLVLVTNNEREFMRVPGLAVENWTR